VGQQARSPQKVYVSAVVSNSALFVERDVNLFFFVWSGAAPMFALVPSLVSSWEVLRSTSKERELSSRG
jgi:hypothetical protein